MDLERVMTEMTRTAFEQMHNGLWTSSWTAWTSILRRHRETAPPSGMACSSPGLWTLLELRGRSRVSAVSFHMPRSPPARATRQVRIRGICKLCVRLALQSIS